MTEKDFVVKMQRVKVPPQVVFAPGTPAFLCEPKDERFARHRFFGKATGTLFHVFLPLFVIRMTQLPDFHMPLNGNFARVEDRLAFAICEYPLVPGNPGEISLLHPFSALVGMPST